MDCNSSNNLTFFSRFKTAFLVYISDRAGGKKFSEQFEDGANKLEDYVNSLKKEIEIRRKLIDLLKKSEIFYDAQFGEAKIVTNVSCLCHVKAFN